MPLAFFADNPFHMETIFDDRPADKNFDRGSVEKLDWQGFMWGQVATILLP